MLEIDLTLLLSIETENRDLIQIWDNGFNATYKVGCMTYLYKKYGYPDSILKFYNCYTNDTTNSDPKLRGRNEKLLKLMALELSKKDSNRKTLKTYYYFIIKKLILDTFRGVQKELLCKLELEKAGYIVKEPTWDEDKNYSIDLKVYNKQNLLLALILVKPLSFIMGNSNEALVRDRLLAYLKKELAEFLYKVPLRYVFYKKNLNGLVEFIESDKKIGNLPIWKLENLINKDGYAYSK